MRRAKAVPSFTLPLQPKIGALNVSLNAALVVIDVTSSFFIDGIVAGALHKSLRDV